jgi:hypothetical protein
MWNRIRLTVRGVIIILQLATMSHVEEDHEKGFARKVSFSTMGNQSARSYHG